MFKKYPQTRIRRRQVPTFKRYPGTILRYANRGYETTRRIPAGAEILGDGTLNRVLRRIEITIKNGTNPNTIKCELISDWNGHNYGPIDNIPKSGSSGYFSLSASGEQLCIDQQAFGVNIVASLAYDLYSNASGTDILIRPRAIANDLYLDFVDAIKRNGGTSGAIATGGTIAHGLGTTPSKISVTAAESGPTDLYATIDATNITVNFGGGGNKTFHWTAESPGGGAVDLTSLVDIGDIYLYETYLTDA